MGQESLIHVFTAIAVAAALTAAAIAVVVAKMFVESMRPVTHWVTERVERIKQHG